MIKWLEPRLAKARFPSSTDPLGSGVWELMFPLPYPCFGKLSLYYKSLDEMLKFRSSLEEQTSELSNIGAGDASKILEFRSFQEEQTSELSKIGPGDVLGALGTLLGRSWGTLGRSWGTLGRSWGTLGRSWDALGALLGRSWGALGALGSLLGASWTRLAKSVEGNGALEIQLGAQNRPKLALKS